MKDRYEDKYGNDSLLHLKIAKRQGVDYFVTSNPDMIKDREELEKAYGLRIRTPEDMVLIQ